jgi:uncharacterized SAM-binding protein YcdF (DUF218 family)
VKVIIGLLIIVIATIVGISIYLAPDDLRQCGARPSAKDGCQQADVIVAVSGGDTTARAREAIALYQNGWASRLAFSGAAQDKTGPSNAEVMRREARAAGIADEDIIIEENSETTNENAKETQSIFEKNDVSSVIVVTSAYHQRRAGLEFSKQLSEKVEVRNHPVASDRQWSAFWWATPIGWFLAVGELVKIVAFYAGGVR